jgi:hypothetical protein
MDKRDTAIKKLGRGAFAILLALLALAIVAPNIGHFVNDPTTRFVRTFRDGIFLYVALLVPLICIFVGMFRTSLLEYIGWALLFIVLIGCLH